MTYQVTARKWRPQTFGEVVGQEHVATTLQNALSSARIAQAYLFCGPRGVGKTTAARILAKALNCADRPEATEDRPATDPCNQCDSCRSIGSGTSMNVLEIDGASNNSVDDIRELREVVRYVSTAGTYKIYIIDEVHMLSSAAFNALLKTLEEPPANVVFIFATTEVQEVPETILSRCQRFNFRRIPADVIAAHLGRITAAEGIRAEEDALYQLAARADGSLRDAQSALDQVVAFDQSQVTLPTVRQVLGIVDRSLYFDLNEAIGEGDSAAILEIVKRSTDEGIDVEELARGFTEHLRHVLCLKVQGSEAQLELAASDRERYQETAAGFTADDILRMLQVLMDLDPILRHSAHPQFRLELALIRLANMGRALEVGQLLHRLQNLERALGKEPSAPTTGSSMSAAVGTPIAEQPSRSSAPSPETASRPSEKTQQPEALATNSQSAPTPNPPPPSEDVPPDPDGEPVSERSETSMTLEQVQGGWEDLVADLRKSQPTLGIFLNGAELVSCERNIVRLGFSQADRFPMTQVEKNRTTVEKACSQRWGLAVRLECIVNRDGPPPAASAVGKDPAVKTVLETFDGELV